MLKKCIVATLTVLLAHSFVFARTLSAPSPSEKQARFATKVKAGIAKLGVGEKSRVTIKLRDGQKLNGYISEIGDENFVVKEAKTGATTPVTYSNVTQVKGNNLSTGAKVAIVLGIAAAVLAILLFFENYG